MSLGRSQAAGAAQTARPLSPFIVRIACAAAFFEEKGGGTMSQQLGGDNDDDSERVEAHARHTNSRARPTSSTTTTHLRASTTQQRPPSPPTLTHRKIIVNPEKVCADVDDFLVSAWRLVNKGKPIPRRMMLLSSDGEWGPKLTKTRLTFFYFKPH